MISARGFLFFTLAILFVVPESTSRTWNSVWNSLRKTDSCYCGIAEETAPRIVGGKIAEPNSYPWMVLIFNDGMMHCGGSLINDRYVLTAGHCLKWTLPDNLSVFLGVHNKNVSMETLESSEADIENVTVHESFRSNNLHDDNDIGLIKLKDPVKFSSTVKPICLPAPGNDFSGSFATVIGWGKLGVAKDSSQVLRETEVRVLASKECKKRKIIGDHITQSMLCAIGNETDACQGDSGGPLFLKHEKGPAEQIGLVSWGIGCAEPDIPGVYTRVSNFLNWIAKETDDATYCSIPTQDL